ncbi:MAG: hypothetical protein PVJ57_09385 [Phycisphaerae bacterium]|jgi:hypothetical protein
MLSDVLAHLPSLGVAGLLFVMWWIERQERMRGATTLREAVSRASQVVELNDHLLDVIRHNTEALVALREELRSHRQTEMEWFGRLSRQVENLELV